MVFDRRFNISVLVVDDDETSLIMVGNILNTLGYKVLSTNNALNALERLREFEGFVDLVITEFNISGVNGFEFQKHIQNEFHVPVIIMSADRRESVISNSLANGATCYILKPFCADDFKDIWKYVTASRKRKLSIEHIKGESLPSDNIFIQDINPATSSNMNKRKRKYCPRKSTQMNKEGQSEEGHWLVKKPKVVWTTYLHNLFLLAIKQIGLERAVPKTILDVMNVPNLTRENVASHLQKYRIFLRKVAEKGFLEGLSNRDMRSRFAFGLSASLVRDFQARTSKLRIPGQQYMTRITHQTGYEGITNVVKPHNHITRNTNYVVGSPLGRCNQFPYPREQYGNSLNQARLGVESSFGSNDGFNNIQQKLLERYENQPYDANNNYNNVGVVFPSDGIMGHGWMTSANDLRGGVKYDDHRLMSPNYDSLINYHQKFSYYKRNGKNGSWHDSYNNLPLTTSSSNFNPNKNIQLNGGSQIIGNGMRRGFNSTTGIRDSIAKNNFGLINGTTQNTNRNVEPLGQGNFGLAQGGFSYSSVGEDMSSELPATLITNNGSRVENISRNLQLPQQVHESVVENVNTTPISEANICHLEENDLSDLFMILDEMNLLNESNNSASDKNLKPAETITNHEFPTSSDKNSNQMRSDDGFVDWEHLDKFMTDNVSSASNSITNQVWDIEFIKALFDEETN